MGFKFKNIETNETLTLNEVDNIVAKFWGKEVDPKYYACPSNKGLNWFDSLGHAIEDLQYFYYTCGNGEKRYLRSTDPTTANFDMAEVASMLVYSQSRYSSNYEDILESLEYIKPHIELCYHLKSLNIIGVGCGF